MNWKVRSRDIHGEVFTNPCATAERAIEAVNEQRNISRETWVEDSEGRRQIKITIEVSAELNVYIEAAAAIKKKALNEWIAEQLEPAAKEEWRRNQEQKAADAKRQAERDRELDSLMKGLPPKRSES